MTVAQLKERMDAGFNDQRVRIDAGFSSMNDKLSAILRILDEKYTHHHKIVTNHEDRLQDLETWRRAKQDTAR